MRKYALKEQWKMIPEPLRKQVAIRLGVGIAALLLFAVILIAYRDIYMALPCIILSGFLLAAAGLLAATIVRGDCICVTGTCTQVQITAVRRRIKLLRLEIEGIPVEIQVKHRLKGIGVGDTITLYLTEKTPVYEKDGIQMICSYIAVVRGKGENHVSQGQETAAPCSKNAEAD